MSRPPEVVDLDTEAKRLAAIRFLNAKLPKKRVIAQGIVRATDGRVLLCELTYKKDWDLPGGVVDPGESPAQCVVREIHEELGLHLTVEALLAVNWLPPYRGWDDALLCLFDLGTVEADLLDQAVLSPREIRGAYWVTPQELADHVAPYTAAMVAEVLAETASTAPGAGAAGTAYLEDSRRVRFDELGCSDA